MIRFLSFFLWIGTIFAFSIKRETYLLSNYQTESQPNLIILIDKLLCSWALLLSRFFRNFKISALANSILLNLSFVQKLGQSDI